VRESLWWVGVGCWESCTQKLRPHVAQLAYSPFLLLVAICCHRSVTDGHSCSAGMQTLMDAIWCDPELTVGAAMSDCCHVLPIGFSCTM